MMKMTVLASGSKGNSTVVSTGRTRLLVDAGLSCRELMKRMRFAGEEPESLTAVLITHEHLDHINGLSVLARKLNIPVYFTEATHRAWVRMMMPRTTMTYSKWLETVQAGKQAAKQAKEQAKEQAKQQSQAEASKEEASGPADEDLTEASLEPSLHADDGEPSREEQPTQLQPEPKRANPPDPAYLPVVEYFRSGGGFCIGDIAITPFTTPHDAADPVGFVFEAEGIRMAIATDLGYMPPNVRLAVRRCDVLMIESNHDLEMLRDGPYPWSVKQRVLSRVGHLSNDATAEFLSGEYDGCASYVILAHLSESNNLPELARVTAEQALQGRMNLLANRVLLARQDQPLEPICL